jgi:DNA-binding NarL/FixJ family response regulator
MISSSHRSLVVEDDVSWQQILGEILIDSGFQVDIASNLEDAVRLLKVEPHRLAVVDLSLSSGDPHNNDGLRILEFARYLDPGCQTILLTGFATVELAVSVLTEYGAFTFLRKENFHRSQFRELITQSLTRPPLHEISEVNSLPETRIENIPGKEAKSSKVLVVDDDAGWRSILSELLEDGGYIVCACASFGEALGYMRREKYELAVVDLSLTKGAVWQQGSNEGNLGGYQLLTHTKVAGIPTIVVSGVASVEEIQDVYREQSIFAFIEKQVFDRSRFCQLVEDALLSSRHVIGNLRCLTDRERDVFDLLSKGMTNKEIADALVITTNTVKRHIKSIFEKLDVHTRSAAAAKAAFT